MAAVVYKTVDRNFADALMESNDPESNLFQRISASWEIGFNEYMVAVGSSDLSEAEIITDKKQMHGKELVVMAGFRDYNVDRYIQSVVDANFTVVVYTQKEVEKFIQEEVKATG